MLKMNSQNRPSPDWGLLANPGFERRKLKAVYFFAGNWRYHGPKKDDDPIQWYEFPAFPNYKNIPSTRKRRSILVGLKARPTVISRSRRCSRSVRTLW